MNVDAHGDDPVRDAGRPVGAPDGSSIVADGALGGDATTDSNVPCAPGNLLCDPQTAFPKSLAETGLFPSAPDLTARSERLVLYAPSPELWSDGLHKIRFILLPRGMRIDNTAPGKWVFPIGTIMVKTFLDDGPKGDRLVETRLVRKRSAVGYDYGVYRWNETGTNAELVNNQGDVRTPVPANITGIGSFSHDIPSDQDCKACHDANAKKNARTAGSFIGFDEIRLAGPLGTGSSTPQIAALAALFMTPPPAKPNTIVEANPVLLQLKRFVYGNCVHCHNDSNDPVDLSPDVFVANTVCMATDGHVMPPKGWLRITPKKPETSVLYVQAAAVKPGTALPDPSLRPMPPVGVTVPLTAELDNFKKWINSLAACPTQ